MKHLLHLGCLIALGLTFAGSSLAQEAQQRPDPTAQALAQMVGQAQERELAALSQAYALRAQVAELQAQLTAEKKRADEAEAKLKTDAAK